MGQHQDFSGRRAGFLVARPELFHGETDAGAQFLQRKRVPESVESLPAQVAGQTEFLKLPLEQVLLVRCIGRLGRFEAEAGGRVDRDVAVGAEESSAKGDRGNMPFAGGPEA